jgi:hypothetical protein
MRFTLAARHPTVPQVGSFDCEVLPVIPILETPEAGCS